MKGTNSMQRFLSKWQILPAVLVFGLMAGPAARQANADDWNKRTVLTVSQPIEIADTVLQPGQYVMQLVMPNNNQHVVQIFNGDHTHLVETVLTYPAQRLNLTGRTQFSYWETPAGTAKALKDWYYPGDTFGEEFPYPKHPKQLASVETPAAPAAPAPAAPSAAVTEPAAPEAPPAPPATEPSQPTAADVAPPAQTPVPDTNLDNAQPPAPPATPGDADRAAPAELPKTGSPYPIFGIVGVFFLGLAGLLRLRQVIN
jgi:LPXTG-motif cell wall-anchored protein